MQKYRKSFYLYVLRVFEIKNFKHYELTDTHTQTHTQTHKGTQTDTHTDTRTQGQTNGRTEPLLILFFRLLSFFSILVF